MYCVYTYNALDAEFGYDCGPQPMYLNLTKPMAKSIVRHLRKVNKYDFMSYGVIPMENASDFCVNEDGISNL